MDFFIMDSAIESFEFIDKFICTRIFRESKLCDQSNLGEEFRGSHFSCDLLYLLRGGSRSENTADLWTREWERRALDRDCSSRNDHNRRSRIRCHLDRVAYCSWCTRPNARCPERSSSYRNTWENNLHDEYCRGPDCDVHIAEKRFPCLL